jgi:hypothetical protein
MNGIFNFWKTRNESMISKNLSFDGRGLFRLKKIEHLSTAKLICRRTRNGWTKLEQKLSTGYVSTKHFNKQSQIFFKARHSYIINREQTSITKASGSV